MKEHFRKKNILALTYAFFVFVGGTFLIIFMTYEDVLKLTSPKIFSLSQALQDVEAAQTVAPSDNLPVPDILPKKTHNAQVLNLPSASAAAIVDVSSGEILFEKNSTQKRAIASITKLFTAMVVVDSIKDLETKVTIPEEVFFIEGTRVGCVSSILCEGERLRTGDKVSARSLLQAMLISSANDAASALAIHIGGTEEGFARLMNAKAKDLNLTSSNFCRPSGLELGDPIEEGNCYSSARDLGIIMATLVRQEQYQEVEETLQMIETTFTGEDATILHKVSSTNVLLSEDFGFDVIGKTGFTLRAGPSLIMMGKNPENSTELIAVVLNDPDRFQSIKSMLIWAFESHIWSKPS